MKTLQPDPRYRWQVASRALAAAVGGYALASALGTLLALLWPVPPAQGVAASTMLSFVWYVVAVLWVFHTRSLARAWLGMLVPAALIALLCWWLVPATPLGGAL